MEKKKHTGSRVDLKKIYTFELLIKESHLHNEADAALSIFALLSVSVATISMSNGRGASS